MIKRIFLHYFKEDILKILKTESISKTALYNVNKCFESYRGTFDCLAKHNERNEILQQKGFLEAEKIQIGTVLKKKLIDNSVVLRFKILRSSYIPLRKTLKLFLEIPNMFDRILNYMDEFSLCNNIITNVIQADLWIRKYSGKFVNVIVLPIFLFYDDLEVGNCLGSHAGNQKLGARYESIACLPPQIASRLSSILFYSLIVTDDKKKVITLKFFKVWLMSSIFLNPRV